MDGVFIKPYDCVFMDPPDNIGQDYHCINDKRGDRDYLRWITRLFSLATRYAPVVWFSFNSKWTIEFGDMVSKWHAVNKDDGWKIKPCVQIFTFGQNNENDFANCHRPLWRFTKPGVVFRGDDIRIASWRLEHGDKRANPAGRVPPDVFDFPRVTGNSHQKRAWHTNQLHEDLVERCIRSCTGMGDTVLDPFAGTGTVMRVCETFARNSISIELNRGYCENIAEENKLKPIYDGMDGVRTWRRHDEWQHVQGSTWTRTKEGV